MHHTTHRELRTLLLGIERGWGPFNGGMRAVNSGRGEEEDQQAARTRSPSPWPPSKGKTEQAARGEKSSSMLIVLVLWRCWRVSTAIFQRRRKAAPV